MDEVDAVRRRRPKDSFQNELQAKLKQRKSYGLAADITSEESEEENTAPSRTMDFMKSRAARPSSAKRRSDQSPSLSQGLGTTTMRARDLSTLLGRDDEYDEDEEIVQANLGKYASSSGRLPSPGMKSPSPKMDSSYLRKTPTLGGSPKDSKLDSIFGSTGRKTPTKDTLSGSPKDGKLDSLFGSTGRKTPTKDTSPRTGTLSKEDIIFGRKTPVDDRKSPSDGKSRLPGKDNDRPWQPPNFRSASPGLSDHSRGSRGVTPVDGALESISETPREKYGMKSPFGQKADRSPRDLAPGERPKPQARGRGGDSKTPPLIDPRRKSPSETTSGMKRTTPTFDLFGGRSRDQASQEVEGYIDKGKKPEPGRRTLDGRKTPEGGKLPYTRDRTPEGRGQGLAGKDRGSPTGRFTRDGRKTPTSAEQAALNRRTPTGRKTPTDALRKSQEEKTKELEGPARQARSGSTLLDFLTQDTEAADKPKPQERKKRAVGQKNAEDDGLDSLLAANRRALAERSPDRKDGERRYAMARKAPTRPKSPSAPVYGEGQSAPLVSKQQRADETSSLCEEIPPDPNRKVAREAEKASSGKQRTERAQADSIIDSIADAQGMQYIQPARKMRPVTAEAKVQHRPKPRYGTLPGQEKPLEERQFNSTTDIRDAIYEEWYNERLKSARKKKMEDERKKAKKEEEEKKKKEEKIAEAQASYQAWLKDKKAKTHEVKEKEKIERQKKVEEEEEKEKNKDTGSYAAWKQKKEKQLGKEKRAKAELERTKKEEEEWKKKQKDDDRKKSHSAWVKKKQRELHNETLKKKNEHDSKSEMKKAEEEELRRKEQEARDKYLDWIENKESQKKREKRIAKQREMIDEDNPQPAWYPSNRTIPFGR